MEKCHLCLGEGAGDGHGEPARERPEDGGTTTACVESCVGDALDAGPINEILRRASEAAAENYRQQEGGAGPAFVVEPVTSTADAPVPTANPSE